MKINPKELIAGVPILTVRDFLRENRDTWSAFHLAEHLKRRKLSERYVTPVLDEIVHRGWAILSDRQFQHDDVVYQNTRIGNGLANFRAVPRIPRAKADAIVTDLLKRAELVNAREELAYYVKEIRVFGSYIDKSKNDLGDIDLLVELEFREIPGRDFFYTLARARASGRRFGNISEETSYAEREVELILKNRNPYLSFHMRRDPISLGAREEVVYSAGITPAQASPRAE